MEVKLISKTDNAEEIIAYCARVSSSKQTSKDWIGLINYCINHGHWSVFEMASMCVEIKTSRAIAAQILRHKSFSFQEFSQRYAGVTEFETVQLREQAIRNRQSSTTVHPDNSLKTKVMQHQEESYKLYEELLNSGVARECARMVLPLSVGTRIYMYGNLRSWIHYINLRSQADTQLEHRQIAIAIKEIFCEAFPNIADAVWGEGEELREE